MSHINNYENVINWLLGISAGTLIFFIGNLDKFLVISNGSQFLPYKILMISGLIFLFMSIILLAFSKLKLHEIRIDPKFSVRENYDTRIYKIKNTFNDLDKYEIVSFFDLLNSSEEVKNHIKYYLDLKAELIESEKQDILADPEIELIKNAIENYYQVINECKNIPYANLSPERKIKLKNNIEDFENLIGNFEEPERLNHFLVEHFLKQLKIREINEQMKELVDMAKEMTDNSVKLASTTKMCKNIINIGIILYIFGLGMLVYYTIIFIINYR